MRLFSPSASLISILGWLRGRRSFRKEAWEAAPLVDGQLEKAGISDQPGLRIDRVRFFSSELHEPRFFLVLIPKTDRPVDGVLIINHGWSDRPETMLSGLSLDKAYTRLLSGGRVRPSLLVLPDVRFSSFYRRNSARFPFLQYLHLVAEDVVETVSREYGIPVVRNRWGMGGFSFGGFVSLDVGRRFAGRFGSISALSAFFDEEWQFWPDQVPVPGNLNPKGRGKQLIIDAGPIPKLFLACGGRDRFYKRMLQLHSKLLGLGIAHEWSVTPGGHTWAYWSSVLEKMLEFHLGY